MEQDIEIKRVYYVCKTCNHKWHLDYPAKTTPCVVIACPQCKKIDNHQKPYNYFTDGPR